MKKLILLILIVALVLGLAACNKSGDGTEPGTADLNKYAIEVDMSDDLTGADIRETISYTNTTGGERTEIVLRLYPETYGKDSASCAYFTKLQRYGGISVTKVTADGLDALIFAEGSVLTVTLPASLAAGSKTVLYIESTLRVPESNLRLGLSSGVLSLANFYPVLCVFQNGAWRTDEYYKVGDPFVRDCADYEVSLTCPSALVVASSGVIVSQRDVNSSRKSYKMEGKALRDFAIQASESFKVAEALEGNTTIKYYYTDDTRREKELTAARCALETFGQVMGAYPYEVFSLVERDFYYNGDGFGNLAVISKAATDKASVIVKETAHQWFGGIAAADTVSVSWQNEALGTFLQSYYFYLNGDKAAYTALRDRIKKEYVNYQSARQKANRGDSFCLARPLYAYVTNYEYGMIAGKKGFLMLDAVLQAVGKEKMNKALQAYCDGYAYSCASEEELFSAFDKATKQDISGIMKSWLEDRTVIAGTMMFAPEQDA